MQLYALTGEDSAPVLRVGLSPDLEAEVARMLWEQRVSFAGPSVEEVVFDGRLRPDEAQVCVIADFAEAQAIASVLDDPIALPALSPDALVRVKGFAAHDSTNDQLLIQAFDGRQILARRGIGVLFTTGVMTKLEDDGFVIRDELDAVFEIRTGRILFRQLAAMRRLFPMEHYYREATANDLRQFAGLPQIIIDPDILIKNADSWVRRKIALVLDTGMLQNQEARRLVRHAKKFGLTLATADKDGRECIVLPSAKKDLKAVLRFLDDDYLASGVTTRQYVANSKRVL